MYRSKSLTFIRRMDNKKLFYWSAQVSGWGLLIFLAGIINYTSGTFDFGLVFYLLSIFTFGILLTHFYRYLIIRLDWLRLSILKLLPRAVIVAIIFGVVFFFFETILIREIILGTTNISLLSVWNSFNIFLNWAGICTLWSLFYFAFTLSENYRKEEIKNLKFEASKTEIELNNLKSQLNPHFMFNSMNSIRALVDENPKQAKNSITQLSNLLRNTLLIGRKKFIPLEEEMNVIKDYLQLEGIRYEERLNVAYNIEPEALQCQIPPLMLQTIVENGIKHGISKLTKGGTLRVVAKLQDDHLNLRVENSGVYDATATSDTSIGLNNTRKRLALIFGNDASFSIYNENNMVIANIILPKQYDNESNSRRR